MDSRRVAVVVPLPLQPELSSDEETSMRHLVHFLGEFDRYLVAPEGSTFSRSGFRTVTFPKRFFGSAQAHAKLQLSPRFYSRFAQYEYILMYHLDALVFSNQLLTWCDKGFDYIGAPWLPSADSPWVREPGVGNGGFALMKVDSFLSVMRSTLRPALPQQRSTSVSSGTPSWRRGLHAVKQQLKRLPFFNGIGWERRVWPYRQGWAGSSDHFWSYAARRYFPDFQIAPVEVALRFAFEVAPRESFERIGRVLPFGCHAWPRYDRAFWEPYLLKE